MLKKDNKIVIIKTLEKKITCLLPISAAGNKLQPYIIYKGEKNKTLY